MFSFIKMGHMYKSMIVAQFIWEKKNLTEETLYNIERGRTMAHYCTHLCRQRTILYSITVDSRQENLANIVIFIVLVCTVRAYYYLL